jgi:hypothetical protein
VKKAAKTTRAAKRSKLPPRAEWDFSKVTRKDSAVVCMREYAKECLRGVQDGRLTDGLVKCAQMFVDVVPGVTAEKLHRAVCRGMLCRSKAPADGAKNHPALRAIDPTAMPPATPEKPEAPPGAQVVMFMVNWRATNREIKKAFTDWLNAQQKEQVRQTWTWIKPINAALGMVEGEALLDYNDVANTIVDILDDATPVDDHLSMPGRAVVEAQRALSNQRKGRGDSKRALLTDLAVYRLHLAGCTPVQIGKALGAGRLKFYDAALVRRAMENAEEYLARTLFHGYACEAYALGMGKQPPESAQT